MQLDERASSPVTDLLKELQNQDWQTTLNARPGYRVDAMQSGKVLSPNTVVPWWRYRKPKVA